jgi:3-hydroxyacyl-[acyl-carrier-protein] dehydratase
LRWIWLDRFEEFVPGKRAVGVKNVTLAEEHLHDHFPGYPIQPASLLVEGMAQTAGILVGHAKDFKEKVILAKIKRAVFHTIVRPGEQIRYIAEVDQLSTAGAATRGEIRVRTGSGGPGDDLLVAEVELFFSYIDKNLSGLEFPEENFVFTEQFMSLFKGFMAEQGARGG